MSLSLGPLLLDTLRLRADPGAAAALRERWADGRVHQRAAAIAAWAAWEGTELWLRSRLADLQVDLPPALARSLGLAGRRAAQAHLAIEAETDRVVTRLAAAGVQCLLIKGPARRVAAPPGLLDTRATSDVDVLVPAAQAEAAWRALRADQYEPLPLPPGAPPPRSELWGDSRHHLRPLVRPGGVAVELHVSTNWHLPPDEAWQRLSAAAREFHWRGLSVRVPSATEMAWHALTHAKLSHPAAWRLRFWLDGATTLAQGSIDWQVIADRLGSPDSPQPDAGRRWLGAAAELAGVTMPPMLAPARPYPLGRMLDWRLRAYAGRLGRSVREKLVDEATRQEAGLGLAPLVATRALPIHVRRRLASVAARVAYAVWRYSDFTNRNNPSR